jgi:large subunit ribosomal protein L5
MSLNLKTKYEKIIKDALMTEFGFKSVMQVPKLEKIVINAGVGDATTNVNFIEAMANEIQAITGQKPILTKSKKAIATFKLRENQMIGVKITLRGERM